jgi:hypothetical protein
MLKWEEEKKFAELREKCRELRVMPPPELMIGLKVHDKDGNLVFDDVQRGHSWTRNFWNFQAYQMCDAPYTGAGANFAAGYLSAKYNVTYGYIGTNRTNVGLPQCIGSLGNKDTGIVVGTGDTAFSVEQYGLVAQIMEGTGSGQFSHQAMVAPTGEYTGGTKTWKFTMSRVFNNNSGGSITVKETGLHGFSTQTYLLERSVLDPTVAVANAAQLTVTYEISMDFSTID